MLQTKKSFTLMPINQVGTPWMWLSKAQIIRKVAIASDYFQRVHANTSLLVAGESKLSAKDMRKVLKAFLEKCQERYSM